MFVAFASIMWVRVLSFWLVCARCEALSSQESLARLRGARGLNAVLVCVRAGGPSRACPGALLHEQWVGVRAACLRAQEPHQLHVVRDKDARACRLYHGYSGGSSRAVSTLLYHPWWDLAALRLHRPYVRLDRHPNSTVWTASRVLRKHGIWKWLRKYIRAYGVIRDTEYQHKRIAANMISTRAPVFTFIFSIFAPLLLLLLVSLYVINYSGSSSEVPYNLRQYTRKPAQVHNIT